MQGVKPVFNPNEDDFLLRLKKLQDKGSSFAAFNKPSILTKIDEETKTITPQEVAIMSSMEEFSAIESELDARIMLIMRQEAAQKLASTEEGAKFYDRYFEVVKSCRKKAADKLANDMEEFEEWRRLKSQKNEK